jgi:hypothetical protein
MARQLESTLTITFRCVPRLEAVLPRPVTAVLGLPEWLKTMPSAVFSALQGKEVQTVKQCPPFIDAMNCGFLMPLAVDVKIDNGIVSWDRNALGGKAPIDFHENVQATGTPFFDKNCSIIKFMNFWTIETPPGYSLLVTHPINRYDLPFVTLTGLVDADLYNENFINFPARWCDPKFSGVLTKGMPVAQCLPVKRDDWTARIETIDDEAAQRLIELSKATADGNSGIYRRQFRAPKHWR